MQSMERSRPLMQTSFSASERASSGRIGMVGGFPKQSGLFSTPLVSRTDVESALGTVEAESIQLKWRLRRRHP